MATELNRCCHNKCSQGEPVWVSFSQGLSFKLLHMFFAVLSLHMLQVTSYADTLVLDWIQHTWTECEKLKTRNSVFTSDGVNLLLCTCADSAQCVLSSFAHWACCCWPCLLGSPDLCTPVLLPEVISFQMQDSAFPELCDVCLDWCPQPADTYHWGSQQAQHCCSLEGWAFPLTCCLPSCWECHSRC